MVPLTFLSASSSRPWVWHVHRRAKSKAMVSRPFQEHAPWPANLTICNRRATVISILVRVGVARFRDLENSLLTRSCSLRAWSGSGPCRPFGPVSLSGARYKKDLVLLGFSAFSSSHCYPVPGWSAPPGRYSFPAHLSSCFWCASTSRSMVAASGRPTAGSFAAKAGHPNETSKHRLRAMAVRQTSCPYCSS